MYKRQGQDSGISVEPVRPVGSTKARQEQFVLADGEALKGTAREDLKAVSYTHLNRSVQGRVGGSMVQKQEFYRQTIQEAAASLHTDPKRGLSAQEAERRLWENGENRLPEAEKKSVLQSFLEQLNDPLIYVPVSYTHLAYDRLVQDILCQSETRE